MIKQFFLVFLLLAIIKFCGAQPLSPRQLYGALFDSVQLRRVFPDQKTFVDCVPKEDPNSIMTTYQSQKNKPDFSLKKFIAEHFNVPEEGDTLYSSDVKAGVVNHIQSLWNVLLREPDTIQRPYSSRLPLPEPYIVPGGRFREIYYWDSYFTMLGLKETGDTALIHSMVKNFAFLIEKYGFIPNGNRTYYLSRSQPPFFSLMVDLLAGDEGDKIYLENLHALLKEYAFWMKGSDELKEGESKNHSVNIEGNILNRYWDSESVPREESFLEDIKAASSASQSTMSFFSNIRAAAESGWDFSSRWFADGENLQTIQTTHLIPVDLNCLLCHLEQTIAKACQEEGDDSMALQFEAKAEARSHAILKYCWNDQKQFFCDYNFIEKRCSDELTLAGLFPLYFQLATKQQSASVKKMVEQKFMKPGGVVITLNNTNQQWDEPNGWAPLEYITIEGLKKYDYPRLAKAIAIRWIELNTKVFNASGKLLEKYNVEDLNLTGGGGEYPLQDGFGWTNGVLLKLIDEYHWKE